MESTKADELMKRITDLLNEYNPGSEEAAILVQISLKDETRCLISGPNQYLIEGMSNLASQRKEFENTLRKVVSVLDSIEKDKNSVENLIKRALGYKPKDIN